MVDVYVSVTLAVLVSDGESVELLTSERLSDGLSSCVTVMVVVMGARDSVSVLVRVRVLLKAMDTLRVRVDVSVIVAVRVSVAFLTTVGVTVLLAVNVSVNVAVQSCVSVTVAEYVSEFDRDAEVVNVVVTVLVHVKGGVSPTVALLDVVSLVAANDVVRVAVMLTLLVCDGLVATALLDVVADDVFPTVGDKEMPKDVLSDADATSKDTVALCEKDGVAVPFWESDGVGLPLLVIMSEAVDVSDEVTASVEESLCDFAASDTQTLFVDVFEEEASPLSVRVSSNVTVHVVVMEMDRSSVPLLERPRPFLPVKLDVALGR